MPKLVSLLKLPFKFARLYLRRCALCNFTCTISVFACSLTASLSNRTTSSFYSSISLPKRAKIVAFTDASPVAPVEGVKISLNVCVPGRAIHVAIDEIILPAKQHPDESTTVGSCGTQ